jgi:hypothetical protein
VRFILYTDRLVRCEPKEKGRIDKLLNDVAYLIEQVWPSLLGPNAFLNNAAIPYPLKS